MTLWLLNPFLWSGATLTAAPGSYLLSGKAIGQLLRVSPGAFLVNGQPAGIEWQRRLASAVGAIVFNGNVAAFIYNRPLGVEAGEFAFDGQIARIASSSSLYAETGIYNLVGEEARLVFRAVLAALAGSFAVTGNNAAFGLGTATLGAAVGAIPFTGVDAGVLYQRRLMSAVAAIALTGRATLAQIRRVNAAANLPLVGQNAALKRALKLVAAKGAVATAGVAAGFLSPLRIVSSSVQTGASGSSITLNLPAGGAVGDLVLFIMTTNSSPNIVLPSGWAYATNSGAAGSHSGFYRFLDGTEGSSIVVGLTQGGSIGQVVATYLIRGADTAEVPWTTLANDNPGATLTPNPVSVTGWPWGTTRRSAFFTAIRSSGSTTITVFPSNYTLGRLGQTALSSSKIASCARIANEDPTDPNAWTQTGTSSGNIMRTLAVKGLH